MELNAANSLAGICSRPTRGAISTSIGFLFKWGTVAVLTIIILACAVFDAYLSTQRIKKYGVGIEMNPLLRLLSAYMGPANTMIVGVLFPTCALITLCSWTHFTEGLAFIAGFRVKLIISQFQSIKFEQQAKKLGIDLRGLAQPPSLRSSAPNECVEPTEPPNSSSETK